MRLQTTAQQVVEQIRELIHQGRLGPGAHLPSVRELALRFGVSQSTVREAIQILSALGLVDVRQGRGTVVASPTADGAGDPAAWLPWLESHRDDVLALLEVREVLETKAAALAARAVANASGDAGRHLSALEANVAEMAVAARSRDIVALEQIDLAFHGLIADLGGNPYLVYLSRSINYVFADRRAVMALPGRALQSVEQHRLILEAIKAGNATEAAERMSRHLQSTMASVRALRASGDGPADRSVGTEGPMTGEADGGRDSLSG
ncbi:MAG: GntR family transcriptional regulator [Armatimonadota bacterium]|nr:GntR family transcriptional regulator [Armatimonadota bacterium]MDR7478391.1 GntR family transcriptional regulator [Armatimonadota bacterium]MDR7487325.1 GntR family transcriptional regulator [Armatimonadota bacterium]MDR7490914.1 GntR family transcriptional regulator [Armatimonadota bacterium]MDR7500621.1 GntR family transcriptional regulator [Armatimonadota bacterium]